MKITCPFCYRQLPSEAKFCSSCGTIVKTSQLSACSCGQPLLPNAKFCPKCGQKPYTKPEILIIEDIICTCGISITPNTKFCSKCGQNIELLRSKNDKKTEIKAENKTFKNSCNHNININAKFCPVCGCKAEKEVLNTQYEHLSTETAGNTIDNQILISDTITEEGTLHDLKDIIADTKSEILSESQNEALRMNNQANEKKSEIENPIIQNNHTANFQQGYSTTNQYTNINQKTVKKKKNPIKALAFVLIFIFLAGLSLISYFIFSKFDDSKHKVSLIEYFPESGPIGSYVYFIFNENSFPEINELEFYYNKNRMHIVSVNENRFMLKIPENAIDGNIEISYQGERVSKHPFKITNPSFKQLANSNIKTSSQKQTITLTPDVSIIIPGGFTKTDIGISISEVKNAPALEVNPLSTPYEYDIVIDGMEQLPDYIEVVYNYNPDWFKPEFPIQDQIFAYRRDSDFQHFTSLPYYVDIENNQVYIYTDHLSLVGIIVITSLIGVSATATVGPEVLDKISYDVYVTPQKNFRLLYNKEIEKTSNFLNNSDWESKYKPPVTVNKHLGHASYHPAHPKFIQDIGEVFEIALENFRKQGFKEPVKKPGWFKKETINHINIKLDSYTTTLSGEPAYLSHTGYIHLGAELYLTDFVKDKESFSFAGHELFHRIQAEYYNFMRFKRKQDFWWIEATAEYAGCRLAWSESLPNWSGIKYYKMFKQIPEDFLSHPINTTGKPNSKYKNEYEYHAAMFIYYLVEVRGINAAKLIDFTSKGEPLSQLDAFLKQNNYSGLSQMYIDFARWSLFSEGTYTVGYFKQYPVADFSDSPKFDLAEKKDVFGLPTKKEIIVSVEGSDGVQVEVIKLKNGEKLPVNSNAVPVSILKQGDTQVIKEISQNDLICFMVVNTGSSAAGVSIKLYEELIKNQRREILSHSISFSGPYSAKLWVVKPETVELTISPDTIKDGISGEKYKFMVSANKIPSGISHVYVNYDFGELFNKSKGKSELIPVGSDGKIEKELEYEFDKDTKKSIINVSLTDATYDTKLAEAEAFIEFYNVRIIGDRSIVYEISEASVTEYKQKFKSEASPPGEYVFEWDFGDGSKPLKISSKNEKSEIEYTYKNLAAGQRFNPTVKLLDKNDKILAKDNISIRVDKKLEDIKPVKPQPQVSADYSLSIIIYVFTNYTAGHNEDGQTYQKSEWQAFEFPHWKIPISKGNSFSGSINRPGVFVASVQGQRNEDRITSLKISAHEIWKRGSDKSREQWYEIELRNIHVDKIATGDYGIQYYRKGWDCDNLRPDPEFRNSIVKLEHKIKFFPSGKEISISNIDYSKSEVQGCTNWQNIWIPRSHVRVSISYNNNN